MNTQIHTHTHTRLQRTFRANRTFLPSAEWRPRLAGACSLPRTDASISLGPTDRQVLEHPPGMLHLISVPPPSSTPAHLWNHLDMHPREISAHQVSSLGPCCILCQASGYQYRPPLLHMASIQAISRARPSLPKADIMPWEGATALLPKAGANSRMALSNRPGCPSRSPSLINALCY